MCSVVGYIGKNLSSEFIFDGLARLEYRGYDAAGFACIDQKKLIIESLKSSGQLSCLIEKRLKNPIDGFIGIGHTRWSTHGTFAEHNAHPHVDCQQNVSVVHNGVIENHHQLRVELNESGHIFISSTDTEVIPHLFEQLYQENLHSLKNTIIALVGLLEGMYSCVIMVKDHPDLLIIIRKKSPLCIGKAEQEMFVASDSLAFAQTSAHSIFYMPDESFGFVYKDRLELYGFAGNHLSFVFDRFSSENVSVDKGDYQHFMLKEIEEQPKVIADTVRALSCLGDNLWSQLGGITHQQIAEIDSVVLIGCGTSWHAACIARFFFETVCAVPVEVHLASEYRYGNFFPNNKAMYIFISQSGETADTLEALRFVNSFDLMTIALTNVATSTIVREARGFFLTKAGVEISVASTKAFTTQLAALYWLAYAFANAATKKPSLLMANIEENIHRAAENLGNLLNQYRTTIVSIIAPDCAQYNTAIFLGKGSSYFFAMESALKLKEIAYVFAQSYPAGELKHGPLALIDGNVPVYIFSHTSKKIYQKIVSAAHAVHLRGGKIIAFAYAGQDELCALAEHHFIINLDNNSDELLAPLIMSGIMQFLMYSVAKERRCPIDKPRNLAKSVTVE